jgi:hypothetical protein
MIEQCLVRISANDKKSEWNELIPSASDHWVAGALLAAQSFARARMRYSIAISHPASDKDR